MKLKKRLEIVFVLFGLAITMPIWYYLLYKILTMVGASELMMFLFWIYVPVGLLLTVLGAIIKGMED